MAPTLSKTVVSFVGHEDGKAVTFKLRVKTEQEGGELRDVIERESQRENN